MRRPALLLATLLLGACGSTATGRMSYATVQTLNPGVSAAWLLREYPRGRVARRADGSVETVTYPVDAPDGSSERVVFVFGPDGRMQARRYSGDLVRPTQNMP